MAAIQKRVSITDSSGSSTLHRLYRQFSNTKLLLEEQREKSESRISESNSRKRSLITEIAEFKDNASVKTDAESNSISTKPAAANEPSQLQKLQGEVEELDSSIKEMQSAVDIDQKLIWEIDQELADLRVLYEKQYVSQEGENDPEKLEERETCNKRLHKKRRKLKELIEKRRLKAIMLEQEIALDEDFEGDSDEE